MSIWRILICFSCILLATGCKPQGETDDNQDWQAYKSRFIASEGRVIDSGNRGISHSEGQGYGMLLAVAHNDRETFQTLWQWTQTNLQVRKDKLFIWRRRPNIDLKAEDPNNASDGDMLVAWALLRAGQQWQQADYQSEASSILADIKHKLIVTWHGLPIILPGEQGFTKEDATTINLSYWIYPALQAFAAANPDPIWQQLSDSGMTLLQQARFGRWQLPPDWALLKADNTIGPTNNKRFGYDAVRIPLYLAWANTEPQTLSTFADYWTFYQAYTPAWIDLTENIMDAYGASAGVIAIKHLTLWRSSKTSTLKLPPPDENQDYYSSTLLMLSKLVAQAH